MIVIEFKRLENETDDELIYRICGMKEQIGTWNDVCLIINNLTGNDYNESAYRKKYQTFMKMFNANQSVFANDDSTLKEIERKTEELRKERMKLQTVNVERSRVDRNEARHELFYEYVGNVVETLPLPEFKPIHMNEKSNVKYLVTLSDIHYGADFDSINNVYCKEIAKMRLEYLAGKIIDFIKEKNLDTIYILELGDTLQGCIHLTDLKINESSVVKSLVEISRLLANLLNSISEYANVVYYHVSMANHTQIRPLNTKPSELADEDLEYVIVNYISDLCRLNNRIKVVKAEDNNQYTTFSLDDNKIIACHGHTVKDVNNFLRNVSIQTCCQYDYAILGHFHGGKSFNSFEGTTYDCETIIAPSFIGSDPYSDSLFRGSKASSLILGFDSVHGHTETYKFVLN